MNSLKDNQDVACFYVTKLSWKGKYKRIFSIGTMGISTYNPTKMEVTNQWNYSEFLSIIPATRGQSDEFSINVKKGKNKTDTMKFSSEYRAEILTEALRFKDKFAENPITPLVYNAFKCHWSESRIPVTLEVSAMSLEQKSTFDGSIVAYYDYKDIDELVTVSDSPSCFAVIHNSFRRQHVFTCEEKDDLLKKILEYASRYVGVNLKLRKDSITYSKLREERLGKYSSDEAVTSVSDFIVYKTSHRHKEPIKRILGLTESCLVERDPDTYCIATLQPLSEVFALVRCPDNPQQFSIEYIKCHARKYTSTDRDSLLASLLDGVRASGNSDVHVKMHPTNRGQRIGPLGVPVDEDIETMHLKFLNMPPAGWTFDDSVFRFNDNILYRGVVHNSGQENKERLIQTALVSLLEKDIDQESLSHDVLEAQFQAMRRLVASKIGFSTFTSLPKFREKLGVKVVKSLKRCDEGITHACVDMLCALMQPMHDDYDLKQEQLNKSSLLSSKKFVESLMEMFVKHIENGSGALVVGSMLDFLTFALCAPYSETTDGSHFDTILNMAADHGRYLFRLFQHPSLAIIKGAGLVMKAIIEEGEPDIATKMQELSLAEGALPRHLHLAMFTQSTDPRLLALQQLSRHLVGLWITAYPTAMALLHRIVPTALLMYLDSTESLCEQSRDYINIRDNLQIAKNQSMKDTRNRTQSWQMVEKHLEAIFEHWRTRMGLPKKEEKVSQRPVVLRKRRERIKNVVNWPVFYYYFNQDHRKPDLIWNCRTREELKDALENEIRSFAMDKELSRNAVFSWNHDEFEVQYSSLCDEVKIGDYYLRLLLEEDEKSVSTISYIRKSYEFFNDLYHRFLLTTKCEMKAMCLQAMAVVYGRHYEDIGSFNDVRFIVGMLERSLDRLERDRLVLFIEKLILDRKNVKELLNANGTRVLVDLLTLAHLHINRATVPMQSNVIEASPEMSIETEKEWYYQNNDKECNGPYSFEEMKNFWSERVITSRTKCWSQGMDGWRPIQSISQLKWCLMASGTPLMNESELASKILDMLIKMCEYFPSRDSSGAVIRPLPRAKRFLSDPTSLPHIVQLLLTFDPVLVEKIAYLLILVIQDNPILPRLYQSGFFYFILMYTGSNLLKIGILLQMTHTSQAFRSEEAQSANIMSRSILGQLLPEAMVCYLENHGAEKFAQIFLGEFDTPEAIWSSEMRRMMIEKIAAHIADFTPRLRSNTRALYQYCPIPVVEYPQLEKELFCNIYYLRHLCDTKQFPDWPITHPVKLLKDVLDAWKQEVEKKPPILSLKEAYEMLGLSHGEQLEESIIRKAYFRLAQKYHPDKNPDGRETFEKVNKAYEFLCSKSSKQCEGPDPHNVVLILKSQAILFNRYKEELQPYKYSGYPMLVKTIKLETNDTQLFSKCTPLLTAAVETAYHTVNCSSLNAEELRREDGLEVLQEAFSRCVAVLNHASKPEDLAVQVCIYTAKCFSVSAQFQSCRERMIGIQGIITDLGHTLYFKHLGKLCTVVVECISSLACDSTLQTQMFHAGILFQLLLFFFQYDYTLEEGGVERSEDSNQQETANQVAKLSYQACSKLAGYSHENANLAKNEAVLHSLNSMLTPYLAKQLSSCDAAHGLKIFNSNTENPYLIWNNATRAELLHYLKNEQKVTAGDGNLCFGADFVFSTLSSELIIGEIFVRVYNNQPTFPLENSKLFTLELLDYLCSQAQYLYSLMSLLESGVKMESNRERLTNVEMALEALRNVIRNNPGVEIQCIGRFKLLFSLLRLDGCTNVQALAIEVISKVTDTQECVNDIASSDVLVYLLLILHSFPYSNSQITVLETFISLMSNGKLVKDALAKGASVYVLNLFCNASNPRLRELSAELFGKMMTDKLNGPKWRITLQKFLPSLFLDAMKDNPLSAVHLFESSEENPELIWNNDSREKLCNTISDFANKHYRLQKDDPSVQWKLQQNFSMEAEWQQEELYVAGVYLRLFIRNPTWVVRRPKEFLTELLNIFSNMALKGNFDTETLETIYQALILLLQAQPSLLNEVPGLGHIPQILEMMTKENITVCGACLLIVRQLACNEQCVKYLSHSDFIVPMMKAMNICQDRLNVACETLNCIFRQCKEELIQQALDNQLVPYLLELLGTKLSSKSATKAEIVQTLKAMSSSVQYGEEVNAILEKSNVWAEYKDQKHDLFISDVQTAGYLTAGSPAVAGYLTQGKRSMPTSPPSAKDS